ncbi:MAG: type II toxin-antitoxin system Phd/YefM family antitoxin [Candidatus Paraimprobicoccus trichonymphae]|uniref:Antitoxin n=1 Tax=Candidatus Paraimprobicoccus trichonymphae TaxID=3033793 RepID=A0AA48L1K6_9FIRM|nr:MAG: type II toxin-antitoxin system Phd/YefM family antitoxin [Candidatus Paraimprobicoccus trichonymphae]
MYNINITKARDNLYNLVNMAIEDNEIINISTKNGNAILVNETDYNSVIETLYLSSDIEYKKSLLDAKNTPLEEYVDEEKVEW